MKKIVIFIFLLLLPVSLLIAEDAALPVWLIRDGADINSEIPADFRALQSEFSREGGTALLPSKTGLPFLHASGSAQFSEKSLQWIKNTFRGYKITVVDLRQESHGFLNGLPISWYMGENQVNRGKTLLEIEEDEQSRLQELLRRGSTEIFTLSSDSNLQGVRQGKDAEPVKVNDITTEKQLCADLELYYIRIPVADYQRPGDEDVDLFIELVKNMDKNSWLHIHCASGMGRTTTFLAMFDMMHNAEHVSIEDIVKRQWLFGGIDLLSLPLAEARYYGYAAERANFIRHFYQYCQNNSGDFKRSWAAWLKEMQE